MLLWATEFPLAAGTKCDDVLGVAKGSLVTSPHSQWQTTDFKDEPVNEITTYNLHGQCVVVAKAESEGEAWAAMHYAWVEHLQREWIVEVVAHDADGEVWVSVRVECTVLVPGAKLPPAKKPFVVKRLLADLGGGKDADFIVSDTPHRLKEPHVEKAAQIIRSAIGNRLPIVYVSAGRPGVPTVDADDLAKWLSGMAHVVVEPSKYFSFALARHVNETNAYGGAISIHWPAGSGTQLRLLPWMFDSPLAMQREVESKVRRALALTRPDSKCTFGYVREVISRCRIEGLKAAGSTELNAYMNEFDAEISAKNERLTTLQKEIERLRAELHRYEESSESSGAGVLERGEEREYYPGEIRDAAIQALKLGSNLLLQDGRRQHIVNDLIDANTPTPFESEMTEDLRTCFVDTGELRNSERSKFEGLGFEVSEAGKHRKAIYRGDARYAFTLAKTGSDHRAGKNMVSTILKKLFK